MRTWLILTLTACWAMPALAQNQPAQRDMMRIPVVYRVAGMDQVRVERDIVFRTAGETQLKADVYMPQKPGSYPVVLLASGGSVNNWRTADFYTSFARVLAAEGFVAVNYDKRFSRESESAITASEDSLAVADHVTQNASKYNADPARMCSWHFSAGGRVVGAMLGEKSPAKCVIATYSILSFGDEESNPKLAPYSALAQARQRGDKLPPTLVVRAGRDSKVLNDSIAAFVAAALEKNAPVSLINYPTGEHGFDLTNDSEESRQVIRLSIAWLKEQTAAR
jgi:acetyl esterase/lipase